MSYENPENPYDRREAIVNTDPEQFDTSIFLSSYEEDNVDYSLKEDRVNLPRNTHRVRKPASRNIGNIPPTLHAAVHRDVLVNSAGHIIRDKRSRMGAKKRLRADASSSLRSFSRALGVTLDEEAREYYISPTADSRTPFSEIHDNPALMTTMAPFLDITEDQECELLGGRSTRSTKQRDRRRAARRARQQRSEGGTLSVKARLRRVERRVRRQFLRDGVASLDFLRKFEQELIEYIENYNGHYRMSAVLDDPCDRLLAHGLCQFHGIQSYSREGPEGRREIVVFKSRTYDVDAETPIVELCELLRDLKEEGYMDY